MRKAKILSFCLFTLWFLVQYVFAKPLKNDSDIWTDGFGESAGLFYNLENGVSSEVLDGNVLRNTTRYPRVLNFFPVPFEEECNSNDGRRKGVCMNTYECRIQGGKSYGFCALGFGVCCVFTATCVAQLRLDFIHFNLGQPNRRTGVCEDDVFLMSAGNYTKELTMCGFNSGHHVYFDIESIDDEPITISMNLNGKAVSRLWEVRVVQVAFPQRAPPDCLQYYEGMKGSIQTMNFADNGRHLANQDYNICIKQEEGMCSIAYEPCHDNAFRISPNTETNEIMSEMGSGGGSDVASEGRNMEICNDKITVPCDSDDLILQEDQMMIPGYCEMIHCGPSLCPSGETPCRIESSVTPFTIGIHFGPSMREESPEDNLGMCLSYEQLPCNV
ncbi:hypothetical protein JTB14_006129 [Gonioctena quinquepunctata]|nr:hypothetical protein JTB14_006129 [Gonioctena quinquepunctata]